MLPLHAGEAPVTRTSTPGRPAGSSHLFTQRISSGALSMEGHLGSLQRAAAGLKKGHSPPPVSKQCRTRVLTQGPVRHVARKPSPLAVEPILAGDTPTGKHHQLLNAHHQEKASQGWTLPRRARGQLSHHVGICPWGQARPRAPSAWKGPCGSRQSRPWLKLRVARLTWNKRPVPGCAQHSAPQASLLLLLEPAAEEEGAWLRVTGNNCGITGHACPLAGRWQVQLWGGRQGLEVTGERQLLPLAVGDV